LELACDVQSFGEEWKGWNGLASQVVSFCTLKEAGQTVEAYARSTCFRGWRYRTPLGV
jgi:hypothetical protein